MYVQYGGAHTRRAVSMYASSGLAARLQAASRTHGVTAFFRLQSSISMRSLFRVKPREIGSEIDGGPPLSRSTDIGRTSRPALTSLVADRGER